jgi:hypothetical protein
MNTDAPTTVACPTCTSTNGVPMTDGTRLCLDCRTEWNPAESPPLRVAPTRADDGGEVTPEVAPPAQLPNATEGAPHEAESAEAAPTAIDTAEAGEAALEALVGTMVILEGGQLATIVDFPDDDHVRVYVGSDPDDLTTEVVSLGDVVRSVDAPPPVADVPDETAAALAKVNMAVAGLVIRAGLSAIAGEYPNAELITPATGWLPLDTEGLPAVEQGSAYAVAFLVHAFSLDREIVGAIADTLLTDAQQDTLKGGYEDDDNTRTDDADDAGADTDRDTPADLHGVDHGADSQ